MTINKTQEGQGIVFTVSGRLDSISSLDLQDVLIAAFDESLNITLNFAGLEYISSAGLRVLLMAKKTANGRKSSFTIRNASQDIKEIFDMTKFSEILDINEDN